jgi:hypothetical protein
MTAFFQHSDKYSFSVDVEYFLARRINSDCSGSPGVKMNSEID